MSRLYRIAATLTTLAAATTVSLAAAGSASAQEVVPSAIGSDPGFDIVPMMIPGNQVAVELPDGHNWVDAIANTQLPLGEHEHMVDWNGLAGEESDAEAGWQDAGHFDDLSSMWQVDW